MSLKRERIAALVVRQSQRIAALFASGREESALVLATRLVDMLDRRGLGVYRGTVFQAAPEAFLGSPQVERRLYPRWRCVYDGQSLVVRAASAGEAQFEAAQVLMDLTSIATERMRDDREIVPDYI